MSSYDLKSLRLPRITGRTLHAAAAALENSLVGPLALRKLLADAGFAAWRKRGVDHAPAFTSRAPGGPATAPEAEPPVFPGRPGGFGPHATAADFTRQYAHGGPGPEEVAARALAAIRESRDLHHFVSVNEGDVLDQARASAARWEKGRPLSLLDGVPVAVKDEVDVAGHPTAVGTAFLGREPARADATSVARLRAVGALILGKAAMHEIGINPTGQNVHAGAARNPWDPDRDTGGSSSGPAGAVAAGICPVALAADGGGSIRIPASLCGLVGLKPTWGRVSEHGAFPLCWSVAHLGPVAASVPDAAAAYLAMAGPDPADPNTLDQPPPTLARFSDHDLSGLAVGVYEPWFSHADPEIVAACRDGLSRLAAAGARIVDVEIPELDAQRVAHAAIILAEMAAVMAAYSENLRRMAPTVRINLAVARSLTGVDYVTALRWRGVAMDIWKDVFSRVDAVATPSTALTAPPIPPGGDEHGWSDLSTVMELMRFAFPGNLCGLPAVSFPVGLDANGLPMGMQLMSAWWREDAILRMADAVSQPLPGRPRAYFPVLG